MPHASAVILLLFMAGGAMGQAPKPDSSFVQAARKQAIVAYERATREQAHVYDGNEYIAHDYRIKVHPFYRVDTLQYGTVLYNGVLYRQVRMQYDIVRDELAIKPPERGFSLRLRNDLVAAFSLSDHQFIRLAPTQRPVGQRLGNNEPTVPAGFYELLYDGQVKALARRIKTVVEDISSGSYKADYRQKDRFFILKDEIYNEVDSKRSLLSLFPQQSKALRKYMRANRLNLKDEQREAAIVQVARRYDELTR